MAKLYRMQRSLTRLIKTGSAVALLSAAGMTALSAPGIFDEWEDEAKRDTDWPREGIDVIGGAYAISTAGQLAQFAYLVNVDAHDFAGQTVRLTDDIDLSANWWTPVGANLDFYFPGEGSPLTFAGTFDGQGHTISGLWIGEQEPSVHVGLFGRIENARVCGLNIEVAEITACGNGYSSHVAVGALAGHAIDSVVEDVTTSGGFIQGVAGFLADDEMVGSPAFYIGGLAGMSDYTTFIRCANHTDISGCNVEAADMSFFGGGEDPEEPQYYNYKAGTVAGGDLMTDPVVQGSWQRAKYIDVASILAGTPFTAGLVSGNKLTKVGDYTITATGNGSLLVELHYNAGVIPNTGTWVVFGNAYSGQTQAGGPPTRPGHYVNQTPAGSVTIPAANVSAMLAATGGIQYFYLHSGIASSSGVIENDDSGWRFFSLGEIHWTTLEMGGIVGDAFSTLLDEVSNTGDIRIADTLPEVSFAIDLKHECLQKAAMGGIAGVTSGDAQTVVRNAFNTGTLSLGPAPAEAGGIAGWSAGSTTICNCWNAGDFINGETEETVFVGGIVGDLMGTTVMNCYNSSASICALHGDGPFLGGIAGYVGWAAEGSDIIGCYWPEAFSATVGGVDPDASVTIVGCGTFGAPDTLQGGTVAFVAGSAAVGLLDTLNAWVAAENEVSGDLYLPWTLEGSYALGAKGHPVFGPRDGGDSGYADEMWVHIDGITVTLRTSTVLLEWDFAPVQARLGGTYTYEVWTSLDLMAWEPNNTRGLALQLARGSLLHDASFTGDLPDRMFFKLKAIRLK